MTYGSNLVEMALGVAAATPERGFFAFVGDRISGSLTYAELDCWARGQAAALQARGLQPGDRAVIACGPPLDFVRAFWGCLYAGLVAVPAPSPQAGRLRRTLPRLLGVVEDCQAAILLTDSGTLRALPAELQSLAASLEHTSGEAETWTPPKVTNEELALLQYTSGSTRQPRGVMLSHRNLLHNLSMLAEFHGRQSNMRMLHWLPLHHDMGLIRGMLSPMHMGGSCAFLDPLQFVQRPLRWLQAASQFQATVIGAPNFGFALTARKVQPSQLQGLDLSRIEIAFCSAEPIRLSALENFATLLGPSGFRREAIKPAYGLAEATVMVCGETNSSYRHHTVSRQALAQNRVQPPSSEDDQLDLVDCGAPLGQQEVLIVDPHGHRCSPQEVGEIWLRGESVGQGYWNRSKETLETFSAFLADGEGPFLRTGDLGWLSPEGTLTVCGRLKDLIIVRGQNFYPQDLETAVEEALAELRPGCSAAFATDDGPVLVCEVGKIMEFEDRSEAPELAVLARLSRGIWEAVGGEFGLALHQVILLPKGALPKTASGKVQRSRTRELHLSGELPALHRWVGPKRNE